MKKLLNDTAIVENWCCRLEMNDSLLSHIILCESLSFSQGKIRAATGSERSKFFSSLALVLNGNASCTAVYVHQAEKIVYIARNEAITVNDRRYFDRFFRQIRTYAYLCVDRNKEIASSQAQDQFESLVFEYNSKKIINRFLGRCPTVIDQLERMIEWKTDELTPFVDELRSNPKIYRNCPSITEKFQLILNKRTEEEYVLFLMKMLRDFLVARSELIVNQINPTDQQLATATFLAMGLYQSRLFRYILDHSDQECGRSIYFFEKTSAHRRSINFLLKCLLKRTDLFSELYQNIQWQLVSSIEETRRLSITPRQAFEQIFQTMSQSADQTIANALQNMSSDIIFDKHLKRLQRFDKDFTYDVHVHAEILLIDFILKMNINESHRSKDVEIGISQMPCFLCSHYIDQLNKKYDRCFYSAESTNGKIYSKWTPRPNEDETILIGINEKLMDILQKSIKQLSMEIHRIGPLKSGDSDIMLTSLEEDHFDAKLFQKHSL